MSHVNAYQKVTSDEKDFSNLVVRMTHLKSASFPGHSVTAQCSHEPSGHGGRDGGYAGA